MTIQQQHCC